MNGIHEVTGSNPVSSTKIFFRCSPMKKNYFSQLTKFTLALSGLGFLLVDMAYYYGASKGLLLTFLYWSFFILCMPAAHGSYILGVPLDLVLKRRSFSTEPIMICGAIILNVLVYTINPNIYMINFITHLLRDFIATPQPLWLIFVVAAITNLYRPLIKSFGKDPYSWLHSAIHLLLAIINIWIFYLLAYPEIVLLFNFKM